MSNDPPSTLDGEATARTNRWREWLSGLAALAVYSLATAAYLRPIASTWRTHISPDRGDPLFVLYILKWVGHEIGRHFAGFWDAPFFYPTRSVLAYSDHLVGPGIVAAAWNSVVPGWVGAYNLLFAASFALTGWTLCYVLRRSGSSWWAAFLGGALYAFSAFRWDQTSHLQVLLMGAIPLTLWSFDRLLARPSWPRAALFLLWYAIHLSGGCYLAAMMTVPLGVLAGNRLGQLWRERHHRGRRTLAVLLTTAVVSAGLLVATFSEYRRIGERDALAWPPSAPRHWSASLLSYLQPSRFSVETALWPRAWTRSENSLFPGFTAIALCVVGALWWRRRGQAGLRHSTLPLANAPPTTASRGRWLNPLRYGALAVGIFGWLEGEAVTWSDGHVLRWTAWAPRGYGPAFNALIFGTAAWAILSRYLDGRWPGRRLAALPAWPRGLLLVGLVTALLSFGVLFVPLSHWFPGLGSMRVPARFGAFTLLPVAFFAARAADHLTGWLRAADRNRPHPRRRARLLAASVLLIALAESTPLRLPSYAVPEEADFPDVYDWLAEQPDVHALLELPLHNLPPDPWVLAPIQAMYLGTRHWRPIVNGYSSHFPRFFAQLDATCCVSTPDPDTLATLGAAGVSHILVHRASLRGSYRALSLWERALGSGWELVYSDGDDAVFRHRPAPPTAPAAP